MVKVFSLEDGSCGNIWRAIGVPVSIPPEDANLPILVDWIDLVHEPFKLIPVIWTVKEDNASGRILSELLAHLVKEYSASGRIELIDAWQDVFSRADVRVLHWCPYALCNTGTKLYITGDVFCI